jgi:uncharacterized damage-inducible protein DinB
MTTLDICLLNWDLQNKRIQKIIDTISDENYQKPILDNRNSPSWILGHLAEADDALLELLGIGKRLHPDLTAIYHHERGSNQSGHLNKSDISQKWNAISIELNKAFRSWNEAEWLSRHTAVSEEDFKKEPHRNKLNVLLSRITHKASHLGQLSMQK